MKYTAFAVFLGVLVTAPPSAFGQSELGSRIMDFANSAANLPTVCGEADRKCIKREQKTKAKWEKVRDTAGTDELKALGQAGALVKKLERSESLGSLGRGAEDLAVRARESYLNVISNMRSLLRNYATPEGNPLERFSRSIDKVEGKGARAEERFFSRGNEQLGNFMKSSAGVIKSAAGLSGKIQQYIDKKGLTPPTDLALLGPECDTWRVECFGDVCTTEVLVSVANNGPADAGAFTIRVTFDPAGAQVDLRAGGLPAGDTRNFSIQSPPGGNCLDPVCSMLIEIDAAGEVPESDEENNISVWNCGID